MDTQALVGFMPKKVMEGEVPESTWVRKNTMGYYMRIGNEQIVINTKVMYALIESIIKLYRISDVREIKSIGIGSLVLNVEPREGMTFQRWHKEIQGDLSSQVIYLKEDTGECQPIVGSLTKLAPVYQVKPEYI